MVDTKSHCKDHSKDFLKLHFDIYSLSFGIEDSFRTSYTYPKYHPHGGLTSKCLTTAFVLNFSHFSYHQYNHDMLAIQNKINLFVLCLSFVFSSHFCAGQVCNGNVRIDSQNDVANFACTTINGNLNITDSLGVSNGLTDLNFLFDAGLTVVNGNINIFNNSNLNSLEGLDIVSSASSLIIENNDNLTTFGGFPFLLQNVINLIVQSNDVLTSVQSFPSLASLNYLEITSNQALSFCCFAEPLVDIAVSVNINSNAPGCNSITEVSSPPALTCNADFTVSTSATDCSALVSITDPFALDNCDIVSFTNLLTGSSGNVIFSGAAAPGQTFQFSLPEDTYSNSYTATDGAGNSTTCVQLITVADQIAPVWTIPSNQQTITGTCGIDNFTALFNANLPTATDNCGVQQYSDPFVDTQLCGGSMQRVYTSIATGINGNNSVPFTTTIILQDITPPVISGIPPNVTIDCDDALPSIPTPVIADGCSTFNVNVASSIANGPCGLGQAAQVITYSWEATDACNNVATASWTITRISDFTFSLGDDVSVCNQSSYTIDAGNPGSTYLWSTGATTQSINVTSSGNYTVTITTANGCCNSDMINIQFGSSPTVTAQGNVLDCSGAPVQITASTNASNPSFAWTGPGGYSSTLQNPTVTATGSYTVVVTNTQGCTATATASVTANTQVPNAVATGGELTCTTTSVTLMASSTTSGVTYSWRGPNGFTSILQNPTTTAAGAYTVTVTAPNNCIGVANTTVILNNTPSTSTLSANPITCTNPSSQINNTVSSNATSFAWTGPGGFTSTLRSPIAPTAGVYNLIVTASNGCTATNSITVIADNAFPNVTAVGGSIPCSSSGVVIMGNSSTTGITYAWSGPNNFMSNVQNPLVSIVGSYTLVVTALNGCTNSAIATVVNDTNAPQVMTSGGAITCINSMVNVTASSSIPNSTFAWSGPNNFSSTTQNPTVTVAGNYIVVVTAPNGCKTTDVASVISDIVAPGISIALGAVNCTNASRQLIATTAAPTISWTGPNGFTSASTNPDITLAGTYIANIVGANGCTNASNIIIANSIGYTTDLQLTAADAMSLGTASITINGGTPPFNVVWDNGTTGLSASNLTVGPHNVIVTDGLACIKIIPFTILGPTSTHDIKYDEKYSLTPNPTSSHIQLIATDALDRKIDFIIYNAIGQRVISKNRHLLSESIDLSSLLPGTYSLQAKIDNRIIIKRFVRI